MNAKPERAFMNAYLCSRIRLIYDHVAHHYSAPDEVAAKAQRLKKLRALSEVGWEALDEEAQVWLKAYFSDST